MRVFVFLRVLWLYVAEGLLLALCAVLFPFVFVFAGINILLPSVRSSRRALSRPPDQAVVDAVATEE